MTDIRPATAADWPGLWEIFRAVVATGDTYPYAPDTNEEEAKALWIDAPQATYVAVEDGRVIGTYTLKPNQPALGAHVCNAGYMVALDAQERGSAAPFASIPWTKPESSVSGPCSTIWSPVPTRVRSVCEPRCGSRPLAPCPGRSTTPPRVTSTR